MQFLQLPESTCSEVARPCKYAPWICQISRHVPKRARDSAMSEVHIIDHLKCNHQRKLLSVKVQRHTKIPMNRPSKRRPSVRETCLKPKKRMTAPQATQLVQMIFNE